MSTKSVSDSSRRCSWYPAQWAGQWLRRVALFSVVLIPCSVMANDAILSALKRLQPTAKDVQIFPSPIEGVSEVSIGTQILYVSNDGSFALGGPLIDMNTGSNLTEKSLASARKTLLEESNASPFIYAANEAVHTITVFTDIDCPHCRRLHNELPKLQERGIDVRYIMLPRSGKGSPSYLKTVSAACAKDPEAAITDAMNGTQPNTATCDHPIDDHMALSRALNIKSTPSIVLGDGSLSLGFRSAPALLQLIEAL